MFTNSLDCKCACTRNPKRVGPEEVNRVKEEVNNIKGMFYPLGQNIFLCAQRCLFSGNLTPLATVTPACLVKYSSLWTSVLWPGEAWGGMCGLGQPHLQQRRSPTGRKRMETEMAKKTEMENKTKLDTEKERKT